MPSCHPHSEPSILESRYCQAQPKLSFSLASALAEISCIFDSPHPGKVPKLDFIAIYVYQTSMEDNLNER